MLKRASLLLIVGVLALGCRERVQGRDAGATPPTSPRAPEASKPVRIIYPAAPGSFVDLTADVGASVVNIKSTTKTPGGPASIYPDGEDDYSLGSGVIIDTDGHVLTNDHIIATAREIRVVLVTGEELAGTVIGRDRKLDLALVKIDGSPRLKAAKLGDSDRLQRGEWVVALGNPFGNEVTVSAGVVTSLGRTDQAMVKPPPHNYRTFLLTDASINPANSGGPLVNTAGEVVGITSAPKKAESRLGFVVAINRARRILPMLKKEGKVVRAWLGVYIHPVTEAVANRLQMKTVTGALVSNVVPGSPAAMGGIKAGDVVLRYDNRDVDHRNLPWVSASTGIGQPIKVVLWRNKGERTITLTSAAMPE